MQNLKKRKDKKRDNSPGVSSPKKKKVEVSKPKEKKKEGTKEVTDFARRVMEAQHKLGQTRELTVLQAGAPATNISSEPLSIRFDDRPRVSNR